MEEQSTTNSPTKGSPKKSFDVEKQREDYFQREKAKLEQKLEKELEQLEKSANEKYEKKLGESLASEKTNIEKNLDSIVALLDDFFPDLAKLMNEKAEPNANVVEVIEKYKHVFDRLPNQAKSVHDFIFGKKGVKRTHSAGEKDAADPKKGKCGEPTTNEG